MRNHSSRPRWSPRLEEIDSRWLRSVLIRANGPQIQVSGDAAAGGQGRERITADGRTSRFVGIGEIDVQTGGGNDSVGDQIRVQNDEASP